MGWCLLAAALFGASTPASKALLGTLDPFALAGLLYLGAALAVAPVALRSPWKKLDRRSLLLLAGAVLFGGVVGPVLMLRGLASSSAATTALWLNLETPATAILGVALFREHIDRRAVAAAGLVVIASALLAAPFDPGALTAAALIAGACACWGLDNNLTALIDGLTPAQVTLAKGLVAAAVNLSVAQALPASSVGWALGVGALGYGLSLVLYVAAAQQLGATRSQTIFATAPFFGLLVAWRLLGEPVAPEQVIAGLLMAAAVALLAGSDHGHVHTHGAQRHTHWHRHDDGHHGGHLADHVAPQTEFPPQAWHIHEHSHEAQTHDHEHLPDLHHRHDHDHDPADPQDPKPP